MIYFTADTHLNHKNICGPQLSSWKSGYRNFSSIEEMNNILIGNINNIVKEDDIIYHLGDFAFGNRSKIPELRSRINCKAIRLILGNHDHNMYQYKECFDWIKQYHEERFNGVLFTMMHYPIASWNGIGRGSFNLHGHCHFTYTPIGKQVDVGVDNIYNKNRPWSLNDIFSYMDKREIVLVDHHNKKTNLR